MEMLARLTGGNERIAADRGLLEERIESGSDSIDLGSTEHVLPDGVPDPLEVGEQRHHIHVQSLRSGCGWGISAA